MTGTKLDLRMLALSYAVQARESEWTDEDVVDTAKAYYKFLLEA